MKMTYRLVRTNRRTIAIEVLPDGEVVVRCPLHARESQVHAFVQSKQDWIMKHVAKAPTSVQPLTQPQLKELARQAKLLLPQRAAYFAQRMGLRYGRITIRTQRTLWGSCSGRGNLNFNCLLMLAPAHVQDYVVVHELCHLKQMNHSAAFWTEVEAVLPNYRVSRKWLSDNGKALLAKLSK